MLEFLKSLVEATWWTLKTFVGLLWSAAKAIWSATTWPARWLAAKAAASKIGLWIWSLSIDPPRMPFVYAVLFVLSLPVAGIAVDRAFLRADLVQQNRSLEARVSSLGMANIACTVEKDAWQGRALNAETKYEELVKRDPPSPPLPAALAPSIKKKAPARKKAEKPWYDQLLGF